MYNECRHIFTSGKKCQSPALRDQDFCYFHQSNRQRSNTSRRSGQPSTLVHHLPPLEDADAIQVAISDVVLALAANRIDPRRAQIIIYGLQVASQNNRQRHAIETAEAARPERSRRVREAHEHQDGSLVAPPQQQPDPEDIPEKKAPSLGRILLQEAEALKAQKSQKEVAKAEQQPVSLQLPHIHAAVDARVHKLRKANPGPQHTRVRSGSRVPHVSTLRRGFRGMIPCLKSETWGHPK